MVSIDYTAKEFYCIRCGEIESFANVPRVLVMKKLQKFEEVHKGYHELKKAPAAQMEMTL